MTVYSAQSTQLKIGDAASPEVFTAIAQITSIDGPSGTATVIDTTNLSSTAKEKVMGLHDNGQITFEGQYDPNNTQHALLFTRKEAATLTNFNLVIPSSPTETWAFAGYVLSVNIGAAVDGIIPLNGTIEISGAITRT